MKYRVTQPFLAFGKACEPGDVVELTDQQAAALNESDCITDYEVKVMPPPENKAKKKPSVSLPPAPAPRKKTLTSSRKFVKK